MNTAEKDFYKTLGVIESAEPAVIKATYKALMQIYHPDKYKAPDASKKFNEINTYTLKQQCLLNIKRLKRKRPL